MSTSNDNPATDMPVIATHESRTVVALMDGPKSETAVYMTTFENSLYEVTLITKHHGPSNTFTTSMEFNSKMSMS